MGAGGLGSPVCLYLAGAGIGHLGILDYDGEFISLSLFLPFSVECQHCHVCFSEVEESNLHRQVIHSAHGIGKNKAESARDACLALNPLIECTAYSVRLVPSNALEIFSGFTVIGTTMLAFPLNSQS